MSRVAASGVFLESDASAGVQVILPDRDLTYRENLQDYLAFGGYSTLPSGNDVIAAARAAGLRGAGGAGFPVATKLAAVAAGPGPRVAVANGEEGEPASAKDRWLLRHRPHLVLDGLRAAARAVGADECMVYLSDPASAASVEQALGAARAANIQGWTDVRIVTVGSAYVAGEETAVVRALDGGEAKPLPKPPRPYEAGVGGHPTLVSNVESLTRLALAARPDIGTRSGETVLVTASSRSRARLVEVPVGTSVGEVLAGVRSEGDGPPRAVFLGGFAGGVWGTEALDMPLHHDGMRARGALLGCGAVVAIEDDDCVVSAAADIASYFEASSSQQCGSCVRGTQVFARQLAAVADGTADAEVLAALLRRAQSLPGRGNCAMPDAAAVLVRTLLTNFDTQLRAHLAAPCEICRVRTRSEPGRTRFRVEFDD